MSSIVRKVIKVGALPVGILAPKRRGDIVILAYHRVGAGDREIDLPIRSFERHLAALAEGASVRTLDDALTDGEGGLVLSFDDGYRDFHDQVLPRLVAHRLPAVLYLATGLVDGDAKSTSSGDHLTWAMLREAVDTGLVTFGSHTHTHADLSRATEEEAEEEMRRSKELIEHHLQIPCRHFAYPWGVGAEGPDRAARSLFESAAIGSWRTNRRGRIDPFRLGRTPILRSDGSFFFRAKTLGVLDAEGLAYRLLRRGPWARM
jgi:peptidoglycan/xylan/chitin deacetylase (PgdA/CDA1 family)